MKSILLQYLFPDKSVSILYADKRDISLVSFLHVHGDIYIEGISFHVSIIYLVDPADF